MYLRKEFWNIKQYKVHQNVRNILIIMGGSDIQDLTIKLIYFISENYSDIRIHAVIGKGFKEIDRYKSLKMPNLKLIYNPNAQGMINSIFNSDIVISAGGQTLYELTLIGCATIAIGVADNQLLNIKGLPEFGFL